MSLEFIWFIISQYLPLLMASLFIILFLLITLLFYKALTDTYDLINKEKESSEDGAPHKKGEEKK